MKLISMLDYCQEVSKEFMEPKKPFDKNEWFGKILNYSDFLKQPLTLGMFVPCDLEGNTLENPEYSIIKYGSSPEMFKIFEQESKEYQEAKSRVLFEGFCFESKEHLERFSILSNSKIEFNYDDKYKTFEKERFYFETIEDLIDFNIQLNQELKKQIGL